MIVGKGEGAVGIWAERWMGLPKKRRDEWQFVTVCLGLVLTPRPLSLDKGQSLPGDESSWGGALRQLSSFRRICFQADKKTPGTRGRQSPWIYGAQSFPCGSAGKESACIAGDLGSIPGLGRSPREGKGYQPQYSGPENSIDCTGQGVTESDMTEGLSLSLFKGLQFKTINISKWHLRRRHVLNSSCHGAAFATTLHTRSAGDGGWTLGAYSRPCPPTVALPIISTMTLNFGVPICDLRESAYVYTTGATHAKLLLLWS